MSSLAAPAAAPTRPHRGGRRLAAPPLRAHGLIMGLLFATGAVVAFWLLPGEGERIAMLERDGKTREARTILEADFAAGDRRQRTLFQLEQLYEQAGDLPLARRMFELLTAERPKDAAIQRQFGIFLRQTEDEQAYIESLKRQVGLRYSEQACRELIGLLRRSGAYEKERRALETCRQKGYRRPDDMVRLASLMAVDGDIKDATVLLRAVDDLRRLKSERERLQLFDLLIENAQPAEAERRGVRWIKTNKDDDLALTLISLLVLAGRHDLAIEFARETSVPGDSVFLSIPEVLVERRELAAADGLLRGWLDKAHMLDEALARRFIQAALAAGDPELALAGAEKAGVTTLGNDAVAELAKALDAAGKGAEADGLRRKTGLDLPAISSLDPRRPLIREAGRILPGYRIASLEQWRADLWKRLGAENKPAAQLAVAAAHSGKSLRGLKALRQAKKFSSYRRHQATATKKPNGSPFDFLQ